MSESSLERLRSRQVGREGGQAVLAAAHQDNVLLTTLYPYKVGERRQSCELRTECYFGWRCGVANAATSML